MVLANPTPPTVQPGPQACSLPVFPNLLAGASSNRPMAASPSRPAPHNLSKLAIQLLILLLLQPTQLLVLPTHLPLLRLLAARLLRALRLRIFRRMKVIMGKSEARHGRFGGFKPVVLVVTVFLTLKLTYGFLVRMLACADSRGHLYRPMGFCMAG